MKGKQALGIAIGIAVVVMLGGMIISQDWNESGELSDTPVDIPFSPGDGVDFKDTLNYAMFETYGPVMLVVTLLLFGAIIGGAAISKDEEEEE